jgi:predicted adenine nucleotide alpha hydrolase (AANH) superfamily ATPase
MAEKLLLHQCCAPCSMKVIELFSSRFALTGFWYNPNIHPAAEHASRHEALLSLNRSNNIETLSAPEISEEEWRAAAPLTVPERCAYCYRLRLNKTAETAKNAGIPAFSTTLLISPFQKHELVKEIGTAAGTKHGVEFIYQDMREHYYQSKQTARESGFYIQKYCGCSFSKTERETEKRERAEARDNAKVHK